LLGNGYFLGRGLGMDKSKAKSEAADRNVRPTLISVRFHNSSTVWIFPQPD